MPSPRRLSVLRDDNLFGINSGDDSGPLRVQGRLGWISPQAVPSPANTQPETAHSHTLAFPVAVASLRGEVHRLVKRYINEMQRPARFVRTVISNSRHIVAGGDLRSGFEAPRNVRANREA